MNKSSVVKVIKFIDDEENEVKDGEFVSAVTYRILDGIATIPAGSLRPMSWLKKVSGTKSVHGGFFADGLVLPHRIKCNMNGRQRVWFGSVEDIEAQKKQFDEEGKHYED